MSANPSSPASHAAPPGRKQPRGVMRSGGVGAALVIGLPLAAVMLAVPRLPQFDGTLVQRYVSHPIEAVEILLFGLALGILAGKLTGTLRQRRANRRGILPDWDGKPVPTGEAAGLLAGVARLPRWLRESWLGRRAASVLDFVGHRRAADDLDDHLRDLHDADATALEDSYALLRFLLWSLPILGFLGTVLGITEAVAGVTPESLEDNLGQVTGGLALAFDTTGLALMLTMATMFLTHVVERLETGALEEVDRLTRLHLAHRFARPAGEHGPLLAALQEQSRAVLDATEQLVRRQAAVWAETLTATEGRRAEAERQQQERFTAALQHALDQSLARHDERLTALRRQAEEQSAALLAPLASLAPAAAAMNALVDALQRLQDGEGQLLRLQASLRENLAALSAAGSFEGAVHSLTAAVHLLTARGTRRDAA
jgi:hypothetical protein